MRLPAARTIRLGIVAGSMAMAVGIVNFQTGVFDSGQDPSVAATPTATPPGVPTPTSPVPTASPSTPASPLTPARPAVALTPAPTTRSTIVTAAKGVQVFDLPAGRPRSRLSGTTELGAVRTLLVTGAVPGWWQVELPVRPNGAAGWVRSGDVVAASIDSELDLDRASHRLTLKRGGKPAATYPVAVGKPSTPTPAGRFFVTDNLATGNPGGAFGPYALGLSGHSDVLLSFGSGDGVLGIHGSNEPGSIGRSVSHGCVRLRNSDITSLRAQVALGTPVIIS